jgi:hypothetical protein
VLGLTVQVGFMVDVGFMGRLVGFIDVVGFIGPWAGFIKLRQNIGVSEEDSVHVQTLSGMPTGERKREGVPSEHVEYRNNRDNAEKDREIGQSVLYDGVGHKEDHEGGGAEVESGKAFFHRGLMMAALKNVEKQNAEEHPVELIGQELYEL